MSEIERGRPEAAAAIWSWRDDGAPKRRAAKLRRGALLRALIGAIAGGVIFWLERPIAAYVVWSVGAFVLFLALVSPLGGYAALERAVTFAGRLVGRALTWLLLAPVFYLFFAPFGLLFRRGARDPMKRRFEARESYWKERDDRPNLDRPY